MNHSVIKKSNMAFFCAWLFLFVRALLFANLYSFGISVAPQWVNTTLYVVCLVLSVYFYLRIVQRFAAPGRHMFLFVLAVIDPFAASFHSAGLCLQLGLALLFLRSTDPACRWPKRLSYTAAVLLPCLIGILGKASWFSVLPFLLIVSVLRTASAVPHKRLVILTSLSCAVGIAAHIVLTSTNNPAAKVLTVLTETECPNYFVQSVWRNLVVYFVFVLAVVFALQMILNKVKREMPNKNKSEKDPSDRFVSYLLAFSVAVCVGAALKIGGALLFAGLMPILLVQLLGRRFGGAFDRMADYLNRQFEKYPVLYAGVLIAYSAVILLLNDTTELFSAATNFLS